MMRTMTLLLYYFRWQRTMFWTTVIGVAATVLGLGLLMLSRAAWGLVAFGAVLAIGFPAAFAGFAFRQLISNRRFALVPDLRRTAALALLLMALLASGAMVIFASIFSQESLGPGDLLRFALFAFSAASASLLISQWLVTRSFGLIGFAVLPIVALRLAVLGGPPATVLLGTPGRLAALSIAGWVWLLVAAKRPTLPRPVAAPRWAGGASTATRQDGSGNYQWSPHWGSGRTPAGTLMRGMPDGWGNRLIAIFIALLSFPVTAWLVMLLIGVPAGDAERNPFNARFFLFVSLLGFATMTSIAMAEWPAGLRRVWLRVGGDRSAAWRAMERMLLGDLLAAALAATVVALVFGLFSNIGPAFLALYVAGCLVAAWVLANIGFWTRAAGWHRLVHAFFFFGLALPCFGVGLYATRNDAPELAFWLVSALAALAIGFRALARRAVLRIDWCAVQPARPVRSPFA